MPIIHRRNRQKTWTTTIAFLTLAMTSIISACASSSSTQNSSPGVTQTVDHVFQSGDIVGISVYNEPDLSGKFPIGSEGTINFPLLGRVSVAGRTATQIERLIARKLSEGYLVDPEVRAAVAGYRPIFLTGEVQRPGQYQYRLGLTVQEALTLAGGPTRFASKKIYIQRAGTAPESSFRVSSDTQVYPGDIISVEERIF